VYPVVLGQKVLLGYRSFNVVQATFPPSDWLETSDSLASAAVARMAVTMIGRIAIPWTERAGWMVVV
jgi:hypothetical protein